MVDKDEIKRRIHAARVLRGITQEQLAASLHDAGLGKAELGRIERGHLPLTRVRRVALAEALRVPESWFVEPNVDHIVGYRPPDETPAVEDAVEQLRIATRTMQELLGQLGRDVGLRALQSRGAMDRPAPGPRAVA